MLTWTKVVSNEVDPKATEPGPIACIAEEVPEASVADVQVAKLSLDTNFVSQMCDSQLLTGLLLFEHGCGHVCWLCWRLELFDSDDPRERDRAKPRSRGLFSISADLQLPFEYM